MAATGPARPSHMSSMMHARLLTLGSRVCISERRRYLKQPAKSDHVLLLRLKRVEASLRSLTRVLAVIRVEQRCAQLRECREMHSLARVFELSRVQDVVEDRSEPAQLPESCDVQFHVVPPEAKRW